MPRLILQFGEFELNCARFQLLRKGTPLRIERKPMELLILLASSEGELVTRKEIAGKLWSNEVFVDTDHGINTAIRKLRHLLRDAPESPRFIETVTGLGYRFVAPVTKIEEVRKEKGGDAAGSVSVEGARDPGSAAATEPSIPQTSTVPSNGSGTNGGSTTVDSRPARWGLWIALGTSTLLLVAAGIAVRANHLVSRMLGHNSPVIASIAVLPLDNLSGDSNQEYFADGLTDELITTLAKQSSLRVVSRTSVMQYKRVHKPLPEIARALNVDGVLEGSVSRTGDHVHLTLQLIRADTDTHLWADSYDRTLNDSATLPGEAAREIAARLNSPFSARASSRYVNPAAHDAYLHGIYNWYAISNERAGEYFRKAVEIQPDYALGWAGVAAYYGAGSFEGQLDPRDALPKAEAAASKAIALDDSLPEGHSTLAASVYAGRWDWKWSEREIRRAVELNPSFAEGWHLYAKMLGPLNRSEEAIAAQKKATELDPFARPWAMAEILRVARQFDACLADVNLRLQANPHDYGLHSIKSQCYLGKGMTKEALNETLAIFKNSGDSESALAIERAFRKGGYPAVVRWQIASAGQYAKTHYVSPFYLAKLHARLGEREPTLSLLEEAFRHHAPHLLWMQRDPEFDFLHLDPQYQSLVRRIGLPPLS